MAEEPEMPLLMTEGGKVQIIWEYDLDNLPHIMEQLDGLDKLLAMALNRAEDIGPQEITILKLMIGTLRIAGNQLMDIRNKISPRPSAVEGQDN